MKRLCGAVVVVLMAALAAMIWFFVLRGNTEQGTDGRTVVLLSPADRDFLLTEMRGWLESVQAISEALASNDMKTAAAEARKAGAVNLSQIPPTLLQALPAELKQLGFGTHAAFRDLADTIEGGASAQQALKALSAIMLNCTGCHASYQAVSAK